MDNVEDVNTFLNLIKCRSCLAQEQEMYELFEELEDSTTLAELFTNITSLEIKEDDGGSLYLCKECTNFISDYVKFKNMCIENEKYIQLLLKQTNHNQMVSKKIKREEVEMVVHQKVEERINEISSKEYLIDDKDFCVGDDPEASIEEFVIEVENTKDFHENPYFCGNCGEQFSAETGLQKHMLQKHTLSKGVKLTYACDACEKTFSRRGHLADHLESHSTEKTHCCLVCGKFFRSRSSLTRHKKTHTQPRKYICDHCGQRFNLISTLKTHIHLKHTNQRDFICPICQQNFNLKATWKKHILRHNKNRKNEYFCKNCPEAYKDKGSLTRHILTKHTPGYQKPICVCCGKQFYDKVKLKRHMANKHDILKIKTRSFRDDS